MFDKAVILTDGTAIRQRDLGPYLLDHHAGAGENSGILFVTFENRASQRVTDNRVSWAFPFLKAEGYSILGVKAKQADWYRNRKIASFFSSDDFREFVSQYKRVIFYGDSMGGMGALALALPGSDVIAISPQVTLDPALTEWETRYDEGHAFDWSGDYQAVTGAAKAANVYALYDPLQPLDCRHVALLPTATLRPLKLPFMGHGVPDWVMQVELLKELVRLVAKQSLTREGWNQLARRRRLSPDYATRMAERRPTPCVKKICIAESLKQWWRLAATNTANIPLQLHVMELLMKTGQEQAAAEIGDRVQRLLDAGKVAP